MKYEPVIGLEIHIQLLTKTKMFCFCSADIWQAEPNTHVCPVCLGLPGALPVINKEAVRQTIKTGLALGCSIAQETFFERKNYFYPDLPKGYQISQYRASLCEGGEFGGVGITRAHLEEDTAKSIHRGDSTLIDFNKSGIPLLEIVSEPDIRSVEQAVVYSKSIQELVRSLGVSDADMEKGQMRLEANISMRQCIKVSKCQGSRNAGVALPSYRVEIKNINSFRFLEGALKYEIERQTKTLKNGEKLIQETRGYDEKKKITFTQRTKEEARDYRYFPEPDLPPLAISDELIDKLRKDLPKLGGELIDRLMESYKIHKKDAAILIKDSEKKAYFESVVAAGLNAQKAANIIINRLDLLHMEPDRLVEYLEKKKTDRVTDESQLRPIIASTVRANPQAVKDFKAGKGSALKFLIGQVMRETKGKANPRVVDRLLVRFLT